MSEVIQIKKEDVLKAYKSSDGENRMLLKTLFGKEIFSDNIMDRIKSFTGVCTEAGVNLNDYHFPPTSDGLSEMAFKRLRLAYKVFQQGWVPNYNDLSEKKYSAVFKWTGSRFILSHVTSEHTDFNTYYSTNIIGYLPNEKLAEHVAKMMIDEHNILLLN